MHPDKKRHDLYSREPLDTIPDIGACIVPLVKRDSNHERSLLAELSVTRIELYPLERRVDPDSGQPRGCLHRLNGGLSHQVVGRLARLNCCGEGRD